MFVQVKTVSEGGLETVSGALVTSLSPGVMPGQRSDSREIDSDVSIPGTMQSVAWATGQPTAMEGVA